MFLNSYLKLVTILVIIFQATSCVPLRMRTCRPVAAWYGGRLTTVFACRETRIHPKTLVRFAIRRATSPPTTMAAVNTALTSTTVAPASLATTKIPIRVTPKIMKDLILDASSTTSWASGPTTTQIPLLDASTTASSIPMVDSSLETTHSPELDVSSAVPETTTTEASPEITTTEPSLETTRYETTGPSSTVAISPTIEASSETTQTQAPDANADAPQSPTSEVPPTSSLESLPGNEPARSLSYEENLEQY